MRKSTKYAEGAAGDALLSVREHHPSAPAGGLSAARVRARFASGTPAAVAECSADNLDPATLTPAAVLVPLVQGAASLSLLLTRRTAHLRDHAGQISFPGGRCEAGDGSPVATALREAQEEVGLAPAQVEVVGCLPDYLTVTGFRVTPVVGLVTPPLGLVPDPFEVAEVFQVPLDFLLDTANHQRHPIDSPTGRRLYYAMPWGDYHIWGATAGMIVSLQRFLADA